MKDTCHLIRCPVEDNNPETKRNVCCACIDDDRLGCEEGALNIKAYVNQLDNEYKRKKLFTATMLIIQDEIKQLEEELYRR